MEKCNGVIESTIRPAVTKLFWYSQILSKLAGFGSSNESCCFKFLASALLCVVPNLIAYSTRHWSNVRYQFDFRYVYLLK